MRPLRGTGMTNLPPGKAAAVCSMRRPGVAIAVKGIQDRDERPDGKRSALPDTANGLADPTGLNRARLRSPRPTSQRVRGVNAAKRTTASRRARSGDASARS